MAEELPSVQTSGAAPVSIVSDGQPVLSQPWLLDEEQHQLRPDLVKMVKDVVKPTKEFIHSGKILSKDEELLQSLIEALVLGKSMRAIARDFKVSRNTLAHIREELETAGKLEPHKQRTSKKLGRLVEATLDSLIDRAERGTLPANIEAITLGIGIDKKGQIDAGVVPGTELREPELDPAAIRAQWQQIKQAKVIDVSPAESQSDGSTTKPA
jgi:hypothetical protein